MSSFVPVAFAVCLAQGGSARTFSFQVSRPAEVVASLDMSSPGADWSKEGREAALATLTVDGAARQHVMLYVGGRPHTYAAFLGTLAAGVHRLEIERHAAYSAPGADLEVTAARFREVARGDPYWTALAHAPILYARADTVGLFTDVPLVAYCERLVEDGKPFFQYTTIFSNEDAGTTTRALMARWGRTTDIEYIYRAWLDARGEVVRATIQTNGHKETDFDGQREGTHPFLIPSTRNNMVAAHGTSPIRYQIPPVEVDLSARPRETVMDQHPWTFQVMAREMEHERKLRPFGTVEGEKIGDPRTYLFVDLQVANSSSALAARVRLAGRQAWQTSHLGRADLAISRDGWVRTTVELPPGTRPDQIGEIGFECLPAPVKPEPAAGTCRLLAVSKVFFLKPDYAPGESIWSLGAPVEIPTGRTVVYPVNPPR
jgi:hypothetical protein